jgi:hypothetical protein
VAAQVLAATADGTPVLTRHTLGKGLVFFCADPLELGRDPAQTLRSLYAWFLREAGVQPLDLQPDLPDVHLLRQPTRTGAVHVLFDRQHEDGTRNAIVPTTAGLITLGLRSRYPALCWSSSDRRVGAIAACQRAAIGSETILDAEGLVALAALDGEDLRRSRALLILPFSEGTVQVQSSGRSWKQPTVTLGDLDGGKFRTLETIPADPGSGVMVAFDADRATLVGLVCEAKDMRRWRARLDLLASRPESTDGL